MTTSLETLTWHDGVIASLTVVPSVTGHNTGSITIEASLYSTPEESKRDRFRVVLQDVRAVQFSADFDDLSDNRRAGNISNGGVKDCERNLTLLRVYLVHGYIEVSFLGPAEVTQIQ